MVLGVTNYATEKELEHATGIDTSDLPAKKYFLPLKTKVDKLIALHGTVLPNVKYFGNKIEIQFNSTPLVIEKTITQKNLDNWP